MNDLFRKDARPALPAVDVFVPGVQHYFLPLFLALFQVPERRGETSLMNHDPPSPPPPPPPPLPQLIFIITIIIILAIIRILILRPISKLLLAILYSRWSQDLEYKISNMIGRRRDL